MPMPSWLENAREHLQDAWLPRRKALRELRARWGKPGDKDCWLASEYFDFTRGALDAPCVDDKTWADLEFPRLFADMDATVSPVGSQALFRLLREYVADVDSQARQYAVYAELRSQVAAREALQGALLSLQDAQHARIAGLIFGDLPLPWRHPGWLRMWALASLVVLVAALAWSWLGWVWLAMLCINAVVLARSGSSWRTMREVQTLEACLHLVKAADDLADLHARYSWLPQLAGLRDERNNRSRLSRAAGWLIAWLSFEKLFPISIVAMFFNLACLAKLVLHVRAMQRFADLRSGLAASFALVGEIDAAVAVASWLEGHPDHCRPAFTERAVLDIADGRHPLLVDGVANSVRLDGRSALITGSNMAGKTTFIKMLGVNTLLAQTLGFCTASAATIPRSRVLASIQAAHSVAAGKSHYFSEVETIRSFLGQQVREGCTIFVIDELFSGTNTVERVAIARAVLESLGRHALVLATTHDVELQALLADHYDMYHFQEDPEVDGYFDYRLRPGPATERNAIRLLGEVGFPDTVVAAALRYAGQADPAARTQRA